jgi:hypothetical protein
MTRGRVPVMFRATEGPMSTEEKSKTATVRSKSATPFWEEGPWSKVVPVKEAAPEMARVSVLIVNVPAVTLRVPREGKAAGSRGAARRTAGGTATQAAAKATNVRAPRGRGVVKDIISLHPKAKPISR